MQLTEVQVENFRSIKYQTIMLDYNCLILLGKNEAGKSNILKAIAAVFGQYSVSDKDKRKRIDNEKIRNFCVLATLKLSKEDFSGILLRFQKQYTNTECIVFTSKKTLRDFIESVFYACLLYIDIADAEKTRFSYLQYHGTDFELEKELYLVDKTFNTEQVGEKQNLALCIFSVVKELYTEEPYRCHYWRYNEKIYFQTVFLLLLL